MAATRFYFPATGVVSRPVVAPLLHSAYWIFYDQTRSLMTTSKGSTPITVGRVHNLTAGGLSASCDAMFISPPLARQSITYNYITGQIMAREYATTDNVDALWGVLSLVDKNGKVRNDIVGNVAYASAPAEFINNVTHRNYSWTINNGIPTGIEIYQMDRLIFEFGVYNSVAGTTPQASLKWGENATDLPSNTTQTTDGAPWMDFISNVPLKFYTPSQVLMREEEDIGL